MRNALLLLVSMLVLACGGGASSTASTTSTQSTQDPERDPATAEPPPDDAVEQATPPPPTRRRRAQIFPEVIETCTPEGARIADARPVEARIDASLGGCGLQRAAAIPGEPRTFDFDVFSQSSVVADRLVCTQGNRPAFDFRETTYGLFSSWHRSNERWELVFAVDDGERTHVGIRLARVCQGIAPTDVHDPQGLALDGPERAVTLYRCAPLPTSCPPIP